jgi:hypothetical protein
VTSEKLFFMDLERTSAIFRLLALKIRLPELGLNPSYKFVWNLLSVGLIAYLAVFLGYPSKEVFRKVEALLTKS